LLLISKGVIRESLSNGLCLLLKRVDTTPVVAVVTYCKSGSLHDPDELGGVTELLQRLFFRGSEKYPTPAAVHQAILSVGGSFSSLAAPDHTVSYSVIPSAYFPNALGVQTDALQRPLLEPQEVNDQLAAVFREGGLRMRSPAFRATELLHGLVFRKNRLGRLRIGPQPGLAELARDELLAQHRNQFRPDNVIVSVVGNIDVQPILRALGETYAEIEPAPPQRTASQVEEPQTSPRFAEEHCDDGLAHLRVGFAAPGAMEEERYPLEVLACLISQGLFGRLLEDLPHRRSLLEPLTASYTLTGSAGLFTLASAQQPDQLLSTEQAVFEQFEALRKEPLPDAEIVRAKSFLRSRFLASQQFMHKQAESLAWFEARGGYHLVDVYLGKLQNVTAEDVLRVCEQFLGFNRASIVQVRPADAASTAPTDLKSLYLAVESVTDQGKPRPNVRWRQAPSGVQVTRLPGGPTLLLHSSKKVPVISLGAYFAGGRWDEQPSQTGWTQLCLDVVSDGGLGRRLGALGCSVYPLVTRDYFGLAVSCLPENFKAAGKLFLDLVTRPAFDEAGVERQALALASAAQVRHESEQRCLDLLLEALYEDHPYGWPALGTRERLCEVRYADLLAWHRTIFRRERMVLSVFGDVEPEPLLELVLELWRGGQSEAELVAPAPPAARRGRLLEAAISRPGCFQMMGFPACSAAAPERAGLILLQAALRDEAWGLHSRLGNRTADARIWSVGPLWGQLAGALCLYALSSAERERELREKVREAFGAICSEPMPEDVLERARETALGKHLLRQQSPSSVMLLAARNQLLGLGPEERVRLPELLREVGREQLHLWAQQWLDPEGMSVGVARG
jgi:zinc protease